MTQYDIGAKISDELAASITIKNHGDAGIENPLLINNTNTAYMTLNNMPDNGTVENLDPSRLDTSWEMYFSGMFKVA
jgi:hypothetical protein